MKWLLLLLQKSKVKDFIILLIEAIDFVSDHLTEENFEQVLLVLNKIQEIASKIGSSLFGIQKEEEISAKSNKSAVSLIAKLDALNKELD